MSLSLLGVSSLNVGEYRTVIEGVKGHLNETDLQVIENGLNASTTKRDGNKILSKDSLNNVIQALEKTGNYFDEYTDPDTQRHQLTPNKQFQGLTPQLRQ